jgi:hypothetical protein
LFDFIKENELEEVQKMFGNESILEHLILIAVKVKNNEE